MLHVVKNEMFHETKTLRRFLVDNTQYNSHLPVSSGIPRGGVWGVEPPRNSEDIGGVLDRKSRKMRRLDFLLKFTVFSHGCNLLHKFLF